MPHHYLLLDVAMIKMTSYFTKQQKKQKIQSDNPIEVIKDFGLGLVKSATQDLIGGVINNATEQVGLKVTSNPKIEGTIEPNQEVKLPETPSQKESPKEMYFGEKQMFRPFAEKTFSERDSEVQQKICEILRELKALSKTVNELTNEAAMLPVEQIPQNAGIYHLNFFEWILKTIKMARAKVSESALWLQVFNSKKAKRGYWAMFKKHGTSFALSDERAVAGSVG